MECVIFAFVMMVVVGLGGAVYQDSKNKASKPCAVCGSKMPKAATLCLKCNREQPTASPTTRA